MKNLLPSLLILLIPILSSGQLSLNEADFQRIPKKKVCRLIENLQKKEGIEKFAQLRSSCTDNPEAYNYHFVEYLVEVDREVLWETYKSVNPAEAWNGKMVSFGVLYSESGDEISYLGDSFSGMEVGQMIFVNLKILAGLINVPVALEVTDIQEDAYLLQFCYADCSKSEGTQTVQLFTTPEGFTRVEHVTYFRSDSKFRDKNFYPFFHTKAINEFHENVASQLK